MAFQPTVNRSLTVDGVTYCIAEHPAAPGMPYGQEGRAGTVYKLVGPGGAAALKVFKPRYRLPALVGLAGKLVAFADLPGLSVCRRTVLTPQRHGPLLRHDPDLTYAVLMPWIEGPTWMEVLLEKRALGAEDSLRLARSLAEVLSGMEQEGLAHCDLSGPNVMLPALAGQDAAMGYGSSAVALVDVEQMYGPGLTRPELLPAGSPGYAHKTAPQGLWAANADRFAGAVLLAEILGWCDERVRLAAWGENYFDPAEMQQDTERYRLLRLVLRERWGDGTAALFDRAWRSDALTDCATFGEWLVTLPEGLPATAAPAQAEVAPPAGAEPAPDASLMALIEEAAQQAEQGRHEAALGTYRQVIRLVPAGSGLAQELALIVADLEARRGEAAAEALELPEVEEQPWPEPARSEAEGRAVRRAEAQAPHEAPAPAFVETARPRPSRREVQEDGATRRKRRGWLWALGALLVLVVGLGLAAAVVWGLLANRQSSSYSPAPVYQADGTARVLAERATANARSQWTAEAATVTAWARSQGQAAAQAAADRMTATAWAAAATRAAAQAAAKVPPTRTPTRTPRPPTQPPACSRTVGSAFSGVWTGVRDRLGCPTNDVHTTWSAVESFQNGWMYWRQDALRIYAVENNGRWRDFADIWREGDPEREGLVPPSGLLEPKRGFGAVWREELDGPQSSIGWATGEERGVNSQVQDFERGVMLALEGQIYIFYRDNGTWQRR